MTLEIYVNQVLEPLGLLFLKKIVEENDDMIQIDDGMVYYTSKYTIKFCQKVGLLRMI